MIDDRELLLRWRQGDNGAGKLLYDRHKDAVVRFFMRLVYDKPEVEGLLHETFIACRTAKSPFEGGPEVVRAYILGVAHNKFREYLRRQQRSNRLIDAHADAERVAEVTVEDLGLDDPSEFVEQNEERKLLLRALRKVPVDYQLLFLLSYWEGLTNPQIAQVLELPIGTVASRLRLGKERLLKKLTEFKENPALVETTRTTFVKWWVDMEARAAETLAAREPPRDSDPDSDPPKDPDKDPDPKS